MYFCFLKICKYHIILCCTGNYEKHAQIDKNMCLCDSSCIASPALRVVIDISYTPPEPGYQPPYYRAASSVTLTCRGLGVSGQIRYYWTSTCSSCFVPGGWYYSYSGSSRTQSYLVARDAGTHTCSAHSDSYGISGSTTTVMNVVGEYILVETQLYN